MTRIFALLVSITLISTACTAFSSKCTVAVSGAAAVIEIEGVGANAKCRELLNSDPELYEAEDQPTKPVICSMRIDLLVYTVRDQGLLNLVGTQICSNLEAQLR